MRKRVLWLLVMVVVLAAGLYLWRHWYGVPEDFADMEAEFKYGSIGSDHPRARVPMPYWILKVLPDLFPPSAAIGDGKWYQPKNDKKGYAAFGLVTEDDMAKPQGFRGEPKDLFKRPIGFSKRTVFGIDFIGVNCAFCHTTTLRLLPADKQEIIVGGTGNTVDIEQFFLYLFAATTDKKFNADEVMKEVVGQNHEMNFLERIAYRIFIYFAPGFITQLKKQFDFLDPESENLLPKFGPGRVDTWAPYKRVYVDPPQHDKNPGIVDFPSVWNQKARAGTRMHWDGNTDVLQERNIVSGLALVGKRIEYLDFARVARISEYITWLIPPRYRDRLPECKQGGAQDCVAPIKDRENLTQRGKELFEGNCAACHAPEGGRMGRVEPIQDLATDDKRIKAFTPDLAAALNLLGTDLWTMRNFKLQNGYVNGLLDGIWLRAPYLHNGSVPTLRDLLTVPEERPTRFCRGSDVYDWINVGFVTPPMAGKKGAESCGEFFLYDTALPGNGNQGHKYGTHLNVADKAALIEYLKTL
jgi:Cytochrome c